jgi:hypothetical protein
MIPKIIIMCLSMWGLGVATANHGKPKEGNENAVIHLIAVIITHSLLYWGGWYG